MASIRERRSSKGEITWQVLYRHGGRQASKTFGTHKDAARWVKRIDLDGIEEALRWLAEDDGRQPGTTVAELMAAWVAAKSRDWTPRVAHQNELHIDRWILPTFGRREADAVTPIQVQRWVDSMAGELSPRTTRDRHALLHAAYKYGSRKSVGLVSANPCEETTFPVIRDSKPRGTTIPEWRAILAAAAEINPGAHDLILFLGLTGWRFSEATALAVRDVYDNGDTVYASVTRVHRYNKGKPSVAEGEAKTSAALRTVPVPSEGAAMLRRRIVGKGPDEYVFTNRLGRHWQQGTFLTKTWPSLLAHAKVGNKDRKPTPHWLRHMAVAAMASSGVPLHEIKRAVGHKNIGTTERTYGSLISGLSPDSIPAIDAVFAGKGRAGQIVSGELVTGDPAPQVLPLASPQVLQAHVDDID